MYKRKGTEIISIVLTISFLSACGQSNGNIKSNSSVGADTTSIKTDVSSYSDDVSRTSSKKYTVVFKDYDGKILKTESVEDGKSATPPSNASKEGYKIVKWDKSLDSINQDTVVTPVYEKISGPTISVGNVTAKAGGTVSVPVKIQNNPGINGATIKVSFDSNLTLKKAKNGNALDNLKYTESGEYANPSTFLWDGMDENVKGNGEMLILSFEISSNAKSGEKLGVSLSYIDGAIYDMDLNNVDFDVVGGSVTIE